MQLVKSRNKYCIANWKMNFTSTESKNYLLSLKSKKLNNNKVKTIICTSFIDIGVNSQYLNNNTEFSAQNVYCEDKGSYTGEISCRMLKDIGCKWILIGHSERRIMFSESFNLINKKLSKAINEGFNTILCVGESFVDRKDNRTKEVLSKQLLSAFKNIQKKYIDKIVIAYEPIWAIGTGETATMDTIDHNHALIRSILSDNGYLAEDISILYGGSVNAKNASSLSSIKNVDGFLIGGASLDLESFNLIYNQL